MTELIRKCIDCSYYFDEEGHKGCCFCSCGNFKCICNKTKEEVEEEFNNGII